MSKNDITGDSIITKSSETYRNNYDSIFRKEEPKKENQNAFWSISLDTKCPKCEYDFNILNTDSDFWFNKFEPMEHDTKKSKDYEVICSECGHGFLVDFTY